LRFGGEINVWIQEEARLSSVQGDVHSDLHPKRLRAEARHLIREETGKLPNPPSRNPMKRPDHLDPPKHDNPECDSKKDERGNVDRRE
jgi:hypothetical protein